ncbi:MAG: hypothetical protein ACRDKT_01790 [Actinomycetota bacterium]
MNLRRATRSVLLAGALVASLFPATEALAAPTVELLNPSDYTGDQAPQRVISSAPDGTDNTYELVAWVGDSPSSPLVEFEILTLQTQTEVATVAGVAIGDDTWSGQFAIDDTIVDGQYTLRASLFQNFTGPGTGEEVDTVQRTVTINGGTPGPAANAVSIQTPANGGGIGFFTPPNKLPVAHMSGTASATTAQARLLFSTSNPGSNPAWTQCGGAPVGQVGSWVGRCTLPENVNPNAVRAVAAVANGTPFPGTPVAPADASGDAHRVVPYTARPTRVRFDGANNSYTPQPSTCQGIVAQLVDQNDVPVPSANVDIHSQGPDDQLRYATVRNDNSEFQAPNDGHGASEATVQCDTTDPTGQQAEHGVPGGADIKHIESTGGTNANGEFKFFLRSTSMGGTLATMWSDNDDDDSRDSGEAAGTARIGWGVSPPPPTQEIIIDPGAATAAVGSCERVVLEALQDGSPIVGANVDVHVTGPTGVAFCPAEGSGTRPPDMGGHTGDSDGGDMHHNEGETNVQGELVFGVTAPIEGRTEITVWLDSTDDDAQAPTEPTEAGEVSWQAVGDRSISMESNRRRVRKGRRVRFTGEITATDACADGQRVVLQARRPGSRFRKVAARRTDDSGAFRFSVRVRRTKDYRAFAPRNAPCDPARSRVIRVRALRR